MAKILILIFLVLFVQNVIAQKIFDNFVSLITFVQSNNSTIQKGDLKSEQAKWAKYAAILGILDISQSSKITVVNNTQLPVSLFPSEIFGGEAGTYKEIKTGSKYNTSLTKYIEVKLFNMEGYADLKIANLNQQAVNIENKVNTKNLFENIASVYYNILNLNEQLKANQNDLVSADTLFNIAKNKFKQGLIKQQDVNNSESNYIITENTIKKNEYLLKQQYLALKILCDISIKDSILVMQKIDFEETTIKPIIEFNSLLILDSENKLALANSYYLKNLYSQIPTLSIFNSYTLQQNNDAAKIYDRNNKWYSSNQIGLKLSLAIPSASTLSHTLNSKYNYSLAELDLKHAAVETENKFKQLDIEYDNSLADYKANKRIYLLHKDSYERNLELYKEGLISMEILLNSFTAMENANNNFITSLIAIQLNRTKISINNLIK